MRRSRFSLVGCLALGASFGWAASQVSAQKPVDYSRDIRPLLSNNCYLCHGPDEDGRQTEWRLDTKQGALSELDSGGPAIVPGDSAASGLYQRLSAADPDERMPPADSGKTLTAEQVGLIQRWIDQGAPWREHWAFIAPKRPEVPETKHAARVLSAVDHFVFARLEAEGLSPSAEADRETLIRRVTLDLTGLPPTPQEVDAFEVDKSADAYEKLVDRLLASPRYGEHMTRYWLDVARYGDTHGLHLDNERSMWPYRDWLIRAFNANMPFDQFTVEQLAGDLLPEATLDQKVATGFNRCNVTTSEGGAIDAEFLVRYAVDRTETMSTTWLGLTLGCAVCHEHKYDPISQKEFYQVYAYFYSTADKAMDDNALLPPPSLKIASPEQIQQREALAEQIAAVEGDIRAVLAGLDYQEPPSPGEAAADGPQDFVWIDDAVPEEARAEGDTPWQFVAAPQGPVHSGSKATTRTAEGRSQHFFHSAQRVLKIGAGDKLFVHVYLDPDNPPRQIMLQFNDGSWEHRAYWGDDLIKWGRKDTPSRQPIGSLPEPGRWVRLEIDTQRVGLSAGAVLNGWAFTQFGGTVYWDTAGLVTQTPQDDRESVSLAAWEVRERKVKKSSLPKAVRKAVRVAPEKRSEKQQRLVRDYFLENVYAKARDTFKPLHEHRKATKQQLKQIDKSIPSTLITQEMGKPRQAHLLERGQYDQPAEAVARGVPAALPPLGAGAANNRLGLARWLVDPSHPLTARVTVNRFWQQVFGTGIVKTAEDFGSQGEWPSHPALLDYLATEFVASGWDVKHVMRLLVTSATYRQSSRVTPELLARDPENRLLARGPRFRLDAEAVRDRVLLTSGLLVEQIGGKSVKPYQPSGLWKAVAYPTSTTARFKQDTGDALYRRSMYTFWKRTSPPPTMLLLDAPTRETCLVRRERTNTPLAALALMNDVQFMEAARHLAERVMRGGGEKPEDRAAYAFRLATARRPAREELAVLTAQYETHLAHYRADGNAAAKLLAVGDSRRDDSLDAAEHAAWTMVANTVLNLDETVTKE